MFNVLKTSTKYQEFFIILFVKTTDFEQTHTVTIFGEHGIMAHIPWWLSQSEQALKLHYLLIQF